MPLFRSTRTSGYRLSKSVVWWIAIAIVIGAIGWVKSINLLLILGFVLLGLFVCQGWAASSMTSRVRLNCVPGGTGFVGDAIPIAFDAYNTTSAVATLRIDGPLDLKWFFPQMQSGESVRCSASVTLPKRGLHRLGSFTAVSAYPFGVVEHRRTLDEIPEITVLPAMGRIREKLFHHWLRHSGTGDHRRSRPTVGKLPSEGDVRGIRPYRHGDNPRDVHWKSTARRGQLHVREYDCATPQDLAIIVEPFAPVAGEEYAPLEKALSLATTIAWAWANGESSGRVRILILGGFSILFPSTQTEEGLGVKAKSIDTLRDLAAVRGEPEPRGIDPQRYTKGLRHSHRLLISSRKASPWPSQFAAAGLPVLVLEPDFTPTWYQPP